MALTDPKFQSYLNSVPGENNRTLWEQIKDLLSNLLNAMGLDINPNSILATAIKDSMDVIEASQPIQKTTTTEFDEQGFYRGEAPNTMTQENWENYSSIQDLFDESITQSPINRDALEKYLLICGK
jgi:hypothetical protein